MPSDTAASNEELVSVICRTTGRKELDQALQSVAGQTHPAIEVVLVDAAATDLSAFTANFPNLNCSLVSTGSRLKRSEAANAGMEAAKGNWFMFLDDDDWIAPDHIAALLNLLKTNSDIAAAYSSVQKTNADGEAIDYRFDREFDPVLLMRDNYIPIHAMLFNRRLYENGCRFDKQFDIFEDWDFWLQLNEYTEFVHLDNLSAYYREGGESDTDISEASLRYQNDNEIGQARAMLFKKWMPLWRGERLNQLLGSMDDSLTVQNLAAEIEALDQKLQDEHAVNLEHQQTQEALASRIEEFTHHLETTKTQLSHTNSRLDAALSHNQNLEGQIQEIRGSISWKLTRPFRALGRFVKKLIS